MASRRGSLGHSIAAYKGTYAYKKEGVAFSPYIGSQATYSKWLLARPTSMLIVVNLARSAKLYSVWLACICSVVPLRTGRTSHK